MCNSKSDILAKHAKRINRQRRKAGLPPFKVINFRAPKVDPEMISLVIGSKAAVEMEKFFQLTDALPPLNQMWPLKKD